MLSAFYRPHGAAHFDEFFLCDWCMGTCKPHAAPAILAGQCADLRMRPRLSARVNDFRARGWTIIQIPRSGLIVEPLTTDRKADAASRLAQWLQG